MSAGKIARAAVQSAVDSMVDDEGADNEQVEK
jgi:hypothetical protein